MAKEPKSAGCPDGGTWKPRPTAEDAPTASDAIRRAARLLAALAVKAGRATRRNTHDKQ